MELLSFNQFINEGAYLGKDGLVHLQYVDDNNNPDEVLKTADSGRSHFAGTPINATKQDRPDRWSWPIFWGLGPDGAPSDIDHPGRIKYTMDGLKNSKIADMQNSLNDFIVKDNNGKLWICGKQKGLMVTTSTAVTGTAMGDLNGYTVVFDGNEPNDWFEYTGSESSLIS